MESLEVTYKTYSARGMEGLSNLFELINRAYKNLGEGIKEKNDRFEYLEDKISTSKSLLEYGTGQKYLSFYYFFQEDFAKSIEFHFRWYEAEEKIRYELFIPEVETINALTLMRQLSKATSFYIKKYQKRIKQLMQDVAWAAKVCPVNYLHHHLFVQ